jgi:hypothetical protein
LAVKTKLQLEFSGKTKLYLIKIILAIGSNYWLHWEVIKSVLIRRRMANQLVKLDLSRVPIGQPLFKPFPQNEVYCSPFEDVVGGVRRPEHRQVVCSLQLAPETDEIVVEQVQLPGFRRRHMFRQVLELFAEAIDFSLDVVDAKQGDSKILPNHVRDLLGDIRTLRPVVRGELELPFEFREERLRKMESENAVNW